MWQADLFLKQLYEQTLKNHLAQAAAETSLARRSRLREILRSTIGRFPKANTFAHKRLESVDCGHYIRERVELSGVQGMSFAAYVLIPTERTAVTPAVLAIHGHGYGSREIIGLTPDGFPDHGPPSCHRHFALPLVERGCIVIAPDVVGFGERRLTADLEKDPRSTSSCYALSTQLLLYGKTLTGLRTAELMAALDYLMQREDVDASRVGTIGFSGGALLAWVCASLDSRIGPVVLSGFPGTFKGTIMEVHHCIDNFTPGLLAEAELPEWIGLIAPRPLFIESSNNDPIFPAASALEAIRQLKASYEEAGVPGRLDWDVFPGVHEISGRKAYDWLSGQLGLKGKR